MAVFGDNSTTYMRAGVLPGGLLIEAGCWTQCVAAALNIPTNLTRLVCLVCGSEGVADEVPAITDGVITGTLPADRTDKVLNYIAIGF